MTAPSFGVSSKRSPLLKTKKAASSQLQSNQRRGTPSGRTVTPSFMRTSAPSHAGWEAGSGASCRGPASSSRDGRPDGGRHLLRSLCTALSGAAPRPQRAQSRTTTQRARTLPIAAGSDHIGNLQSIQPSTTIGVLPPTSTPHTVGPALEYYSQYSRHSAMVGLTLGGEYCPVRDCD